MTPVSLQERFGGNTAQENGNGRSISVRSISRQRVVRYGQGAPLGIRAKNHKKNLVEKAQTTLGKGQSNICQSNTWYVNVGMRGAGRNAGQVGIDGHAGIGGRVGIDGRFPLPSTDLTCRSSLMAEVGHLFLESVPRAVAGSFRLRCIHATIG